MTATNDHGEHSPRLVWHAGRVVTSPPRFWPWVVLLRLVGQIAWAVENMYLNVYVYDTITSRCRGRTASERKDHEAGKVVPQSGSARFM